MAGRQSYIPQSSIEIYTAPDNSIQLQVKLEQETVWLTQKQLADLFGVKKAAISKHISNIYVVEELDPLSTVSKMETVQIEGTRTIVRHVDYYNLDMILSIGYRVNSRRAISFRQWANKVLKEYLVKGYALRTNMQLKQYEELKQLVGVLQQTIQNEALTTNEARDLVKVVTDYTYALDTLDNYDYQRLAISDTEGTERFHATYENAMEAILLMIAESRTEEKDVMVKVVVNLINKKN